MRQEEPDDATRVELAGIFHGGGVDFEPEVRERLGLRSREFASITGEDNPRITPWVYVGGEWWCRKVESSDPVELPCYQYARLVAIENDRSWTNVVGLWDRRRHFVQQPPVVVYNSGGRRGVVVGRNEFEVLVRWDGEVLGCPVRRFEDLRFEFVEDEQEYRVIFSKIKKHV